MRSSVRWACRLFPALFIVSVASLVAAQRQPQNETVPASRHSDDQRPTLRRVACDRVVSHVDHAMELVYGKNADISKIAQDLNTTIAWVEHCMIVYGRRAKRPGLETAESREMQIEQWEENEVEEVAPEDTDESGERERAVKQEKQRKLVPERTPRSTY